jgi:hypothetical protein
VETIVGSTADPPAANGSGVVDGWAAVAAPPGWTVGDTIRLRARLDRTADR